MSCKIWGHFQFSYVVVKLLFFELVTFINQAVRDVPGVVGWDIMKGLVIPAPRQLAIT